MHRDERSKNVVHVTVTIQRALNSDDIWPTWVECALTDVAGRQWLFQDKHAIFTTADIDSKSVFPQPGTIRCIAVARRLREDGQVTIVIDTELPDAVEATTGETRFEVSIRQLAGIGDANMLPTDA